MYIDIQIYGRFIQIDIEFYGFIDKQNVIYTLYIHMHLQYYLIQYYLYTDDMCVYIYIICTSDTGTRIVCEATSWLDVSPARDFDYEARYFPCWTLPLPTWYCSGPYKESHVKHALSNFFDQHVCQFLQDSPLEGVKIPTSCWSSSDTLIGLQAKDDPCGQQNSTVPWWLS